MVTAVQSKPKKAAGGKKFKYRPVIFEDDKKTG